MRFGGHETFAIREGWLHKGLKLVVEEPEALVSEDVADWLGVGRNMAKSIRHWLVATGLAAPAENQRRQLTRKTVLEATPLGSLVWNRDRYLTEIGTWWALHINLVHSPQNALTWAWFFNSFNQDRFDRLVCQESLKRHMQLSRQRMPSDRTLERDGELSTQPVPHRIHGNACGNFDQPFERRNLRSGKRKRLEGCRAFAR